MISNPVHAQTTPVLGTASSFAVLGSASVTNTGPSVVNGDLGVSPGNTITGFPIGIVTPPGVIHTANAVALQAQNDATTAFNNLAGQGPCTDLTGQDLGGLTLIEGVYCFSAAAQLTGTLTLDAQGDPAAVFVFQIGSTLTTASNAAVLTINSANSCNIWWQVGSSATIGTTTVFGGSILAQASVTLMTGASVSGRAIALTGSVTMDTNTVGSPACIPVATPNPALSLTIDEGGITAAPGGLITYTINFENTGNVDLVGVTLTNALPADTTFNAAASTAGWDCAVIPCTFTVGALAVGATGSVTFTVTVDDPTATILISDTANVTSGATSATASDSTPVSLAAVPTATPTTAPIVVSTSAPQAVAAQAVQASPTFTLIASPTITSTVQIAIGMPNTGGGPPQATYWLHQKRQ